MSETAHGAGAPVDYVVQALLASVAGVCGAGVLARVTETWSEPLILWQALVGGPSNGKTPALEALRRPLAAVEKMTAPEKRGPDRDRSGHYLARAARGGAQAAGRRAAVARRARRLARRARLQRPRRGAAAQRASRHLVAAAHGARSGQPCYKHHRLPRSRAPRRGAFGQRRRPRRPLPLCLAAARAVSLLPRSAGLPRERGGGCPAAHRPRRRRSRPAAGAVAQRTGAPAPRRPSRPAASGAAALRRRRGGLARQGPRHGGAAGVGARAAGRGRRTPRPPRRRPASSRASAVRGVPPLGLFPRPRARGPGPRLPVGRRAPDAPGARLDPRPRRGPDQPRGRAPRRARPGAERAPVAAGDPVAGALRLPAQGRGRLCRQRPAGAALGRQPGADWRSACGNCGNCETPAAVL